MLSNAGKPGTSPAHPHLAGPAAALAPLLSVSGPFWRGRNLRRLLAALIPFALACVLTHKALSGQWLNFYPSSYAPWSLGGSVLFPLNIFHAPGHVLVVGVLLSLLVVAPLIAAQSFGIAPAIFFLACIFGFAHLPTLALFQAIGLFLAAVPPLLRRTRFYSGLLALLPSILYLFLEAQIVLAWAKHTVITPSPASLADLAQQASSPALSTRAVEVLVSPQAVGIIIAVCLPLAFIASLPSLLNRTRCFSLLFVSAIILAYLACSVFMFIQPDDYAAAGPVASASELVWPEIAYAGQASRHALINLTPIQQTWLYAPSMLAVVLSLVALPVLWLIHRCGKSSSAVLSWMSLANVAVSLLCFYILVGVETLDFNVLKARFETGSALLTEMPALNEYRHRLAEYNLASDPVARLKLEQKRTGLADLLRQNPGPHRSAQLRAEIAAVDRDLRYARQPGRAAILLRINDRIFRILIGQFEERVTLAKDACDYFLDRYPHSRQKPYVLHIRAMITDARLDLQLLKKQGTVRVYHNFPSSDSIGTRRQLLREFPNHVLACPNGLALAQLLGRDGDFESALGILQQAYKAGQDFQDSFSNPRFGGSLLDNLGLPPAEPVAPEQIPALLRRNRALAELITSNYRDPIHGYEPLRRLFTKDPQQPDYIDQIAQIVRDFPDALVADNIRLKIILAQPPDYRLYALRSALQEYAVSDIAKDVLFSLAELEMTLAESDPRKSDLRSQAIEHLRRFLDTYPDAYQKPLAQEYLARLVSITSPAKQQPSEP